MFIRVASNLLLYFGITFFISGTHADPEGAEPVHSDPRLRVMTYNIHHGEGVDGRLDLKRIAEVILDARPHVVALQEVDQGVERTGRRDLPEELSKLTGMKAVFGGNLKYQGGDYGNLILTSLPVVSVENIHYQMIREGEQRGLLMAELQYNGETLHFWNTHLDYRPDPVERIANVAEIQSQQQKAQGRDILLCGDFNEEPGGVALTKLKSTFRDAWVVAHPSQPGNTYSSTKPQKRIDYVFVGKQSSLKPVEGRVLTTEASDHLPMVMEFEWLKSNP